MPVTNPCLVCGTLVTVKPSRAAKGAGKFCSRACKGQWRSRTALGYDPAKRVAKHCQVCGKEILVKQSHVDKEGTYCSRECMTQGYRTAMRGEANPNFKDGQANTPEWRRAWAKRWRANHKEYISASNRRTKAIRKGAIGAHTERDVRDLRARQETECVYCHANLDGGYHVDHIIPLARGGTNYVGNLQLLCPTCNLRKKATLPIEFRARHGYFDDWLIAK